MLNPTGDNPGAAPPPEDKLIREAYARAKAEFTEADLERYLQEEEGLPFEDVIHEIEELERQRNGERGQG
jgi:hypothetical protein